MIQVRHKREHRFSPTLHWIAARLSNFDNEALDVIDVAALVAAAAAV